MKTLVASLADNKAALGRRYAEWAVSAPTLESAVAAAAMAQDELGHSRSTYPVLKQLGADVGDERLRRRPRLALLDDELPDWNAFIAANLLVDGVLTTFVASCVDSSLEPMAQRAKQDPPGGGLAPRPRRGVGEAPVPRRPARRVRRPPAGDLGARRPLDRARRRRRVRRRAGGRRDPKHGPAEQRELMRAWLSELLDAEGVSIDLPELTWDGWDAERRRWEPDLPVLLVGRRRARRPVGRPDHHRPVALRRLQLLLRGRPRGLRRYSCAMANSRTRFPFNVINQTVNRFTRPLLRSPAHGVLSDKLLLLTFTGRKTGRRFSIPMNYTEQGDKILLVPQSPERKTWWRNLRGEGAPVRVRLRGTDRTGWAVATGDERDRRADRAHARSEPDAL